MLLFYWTSDGGTLRFKASGIDRAIDGIQTSFIAYCIEFPMSDTSIPNILVGMQCVMSTKALINSHRTKKNLFHFTC
jgi:hypothetical protein